MRTYTPADSPCTCTETVLCDACKATRARIAALFHRVIDIQDEEETAM